MAALSELQEARQDSETQRWVQTWKLSLGGLRGWRLLEDGADGEKYLGKINGQPIVVIWSIAREEDGKPWLHVSASHPSRVPTWEEMAEVKRLFVGADRFALQLHPPEAVYVNIHARVLHLWAPVEHWPLPEFSAVVDGIGRTV